MTKPLGDKSLPFLAGTTVATLMMAVCVAPLTAETLDPCTLCIAKIQNWAVKPGSPCHGMNQGYQREQCIWNQVQLWCVQATPERPNPPCNRPPFEADGQPDCESRDCAFDPLLWDSGQRLCGWQCWNRLCNYPATENKCFDRRKDEQACRQALVTSECIECKCAASSDW